MNYILVQPSQLGVCAFIMQVVSFKAMQICCSQWAEKTSTNESTNWTYKQCNLVEKKKLAKPLRKTCMIPSLLKLLKCSILKLSN